MSGTTTRPSLGADLARALGGGDEIPVERLPVAVTARQPGAATDRAMADLVTAQRVAVKRDIPNVLRNIQALASAAGARFYYSIPFKNRKTGAVEPVEGISIKGALAVVTAYGNARVRCIVAEETQASWLFLAEFVDLETGFTLVRPFQQRKGQDTGMRDGARQGDMVFQIGASKAIRNVVANALPLYCEEAFEAAKQSLADKIGRNPDGARNRLVEIIEGMGIPLPRVERVLGRAAGAWVVRDMARLHTMLTAIQDGMATVDDLFPRPEDDEEPQEAQQAQGQQDGGAPPPADPPPPPPKAEQKPARAPRQARQAPPPQPEPPPREEPPPAGPEDAPAGGPPPDDEDEEETPPPPPAKGGGGFDFGS